jgi:3-dehydroquinate dehydratase / shikimate dehydrogenase
MNSPATSLSPNYLRSRIGKICVAIIGADAAELLARAEAVYRETPFLEFRLDYLAKPLSALPKLKTFLAEHPEVTAIATCRRSAHGGKFSGNNAAELDVLQKAAAAGFQLVDVELQTAEAVKRQELEKLRTHGAAVILSYHDFVATKGLDAVFERILKLEPEFIKIVSTARSLADNITVLRFLDRTRDQANIVGICMGEQGVISRILGPRSGSLFTFASATSGEETAPGQFSARTLLDVYRIDQLDAATKIYGVAGDPVTHSLSPAMLNAAFRRERVNSVYLPLQTSALTDLLALIREVPLSGFSVTMPFKRDILKHLQKTDPLSEKIGACNTVVRSQDGNLYGFNTDVAAVVRPLEKRIALRGAKVLVLGAGGAARAAVFGLREKGAEVFILNRTLPTAQKLARESGSKTLKQTQLAKTAFDIIVNATPVGMRGSKAQSMLKPDEINARLVFDLVYNPIDTPLIKAAREKGIPFITGVEMFVHQGARQFEIWTGKPAPEEEMQRVVIHELRQRAQNVPEKGARI